MCIQNEVMLLQMQQVDIYTNVGKKGNIKERKNNGKNKKLAICTQREKHSCVSRETTVTN